MRSPVCGLAAISLLFCASAAFAADAATTCEATKLKLSAKYGSCRLSAYYKGVKTHSGPDFSKCSLERFPKAEDNAGGACPTIGDESSIQDFVDNCTDQIATALGSGGLDACETNLSTCQSDLLACQSDCVASVRPPLRSGQTSCYNIAGSSIPCAGTGQDGEFQNGAARSFTDSGDGTVTDNTTGLMWEKLSDEGDVHDRDAFYTWDDAFASKVATLNSGNFAGHNDWRLPNLLELHTLVNLGEFNPATFSVFNTACTTGCAATTCSCTWTTYWSATTSGNSTGNAWAVYSYDGHTLIVPKGASQQVRAVRGSS